MLSPSTHGGHARLGGLARYAAPAESPAGGAPQHALEQVSCCKRHSQPGIEDWLGGMSADGVGGNIYAALRADLGCARHRLGSRRKVRRVSQGVAERLPSGDAVLGVPGAFYIWWSFWMYGMVGWPQRRGRGASATRGRADGSDGRDERKVRCEAYSDEEIPSLLPYRHSKTASSPHNNSQSSSRVPASGVAKAVITDKTLQFS